MMGLPLAFASPLVLIGLLSLPVLWWLLRLIPPRPRRIHFPPTRLLFDIAPKEETPARTPWWLTLLRLTLAALVIIAAAGPLWNPPVATSSGAASLALLIDDGWSAAASWEARLRTADDIIARAEADNRGVALMPLSEPVRDISLEPPAAARVRLRQLKPKPHTVERDRCDREYRTLPQRQRPMSRWSGCRTASMWAAGPTSSTRSPARSSGVRSPWSKADFRRRRRWPRPTTQPARSPSRCCAQRPESDAGGIIRALDLKGLPLGETRFSFKAGDRETEAEFTLPVEIRNDIARLEIGSERSAGAVQLLDKRWRRRTIGVVSGATAETAQPLLASTYYLSRALNPFADVRLAEGAAPAEAVRRFLDQNVPMLILADVGNVAGDARDRLTRWIEDGGVLVRFAGPRLAAANDDLVPVKLRRGGRILGGSLSWEQPQKLAAFARESPFGGMPVPDDVTVNRQVLAEPDSGLTERTWATLADGTPLVTAQRRGKGVIVLFHVTADTRWSDLPLSGSFVEMLKRIVSIAGSTTVTEAGGPQRARRARRRSANPRARRLRDVRPAAGESHGRCPPAMSVARAPIIRRASMDRPRVWSRSTRLRLQNAWPRLISRPLNAHREAYRVGEPLDLRGPIFIAALALFVLDALVVFALAGGFARLARRRRPAAAAGLLLVLAAGAATTWTPRASAQSDDFALRSTLETRLAYVITGNAEVDNISRTGLRGLTRFLAQRTALEAGEPTGLDVARDELAFFPLIYWPIVQGAEKPSPQALARIDAYMKQGGTVLFDTRDAIMAPPGPGGESRSPGMVGLRSILSSLDVPELEPVSKDHVLTKTFFLLRDFPGRFNSGQLWVEALQADNETEEEGRRPARAGDGVSSILITSNDLAGAWATRPDGQPMLPLVPGEPRQREFAFRAGVNIVMYTLTGNYKADQVHVPALLERLGQ